MEERQEIGRKTPVICTHEIGRKTVGGKTQVSRRKTQVSGRKIQVSGRKTQVSARKTQGSARKIQAVGSNTGILSWKKDSTHLEKRHKLLSWKKYKH